MNRFKDTELSRRNNLVMTMKNKFEPIENSNEISNSNKPKPHTKTLPSLSRQLSDPVKVKRTPAFRSDQKPFQRGHATSYREKKTVLKVSDKPSSVHLLRKQFDANDDATGRVLGKRIIPMALNERSNSCAEIILNRRSHHDYANIAALYTEPIPKNQRPSNAIHNMSTLKITDKKSDKTEPIFQNVQNVQNANHQKRISDDINFKLEALTDTLKLALRKPLPTGPAPQKPPRTFTHLSGNSSLPTSPLMVNNKNSNSRKEFAAKLNVNLQKNLKQNMTNNNLTLASNSSSNKPDAKYMLEKLENALKTNRMKRNVRSSSEDRRSVKVDNLNATSRSKINLNCLHSLTCTNNAYERLPDMHIEPIGTGDEPVYAEPFAFLKAQNPVITHRGRSNDGTRNGKTNRNSLYYMSTPITTDSCAAHHNNGDDDLMEFPRMESTEPLQRTDDDGDTPSSSLSSMDESPPKIKDLIKTFEATGSDRVEKLEKQLRRTLEQSFNDSSSSTSGLNSNNNNIDHDTEDRKSDEAIVGKFETYVRAIKLITQSRKKFEKRQMFHCCMLVTLCDKEPFIKFKYPCDAKLPVKIEALCFPDSNSFDSSPKAQNYSLVITNDDGERIYGYCRRVLPEDSQTCLPLAYCILSKNRAPRFYKRILEEIECRHGIPDQDRDILLREFYLKRFPNPGETIAFQLNRPTHYAVVNGGGASVESIKIILHQDARHKENDMEELCQCLDTNLLLKVFASLLLERKVILLSSQLGRLSTCMEALQNLLYPFSWPHTLIPVVPTEWWEIVEAPTPLICGVLSVEVVAKHDINDAIVIDLDNRSVLQEVGDEMSIIPYCLVKEFKNGLALAKSSNENRSVYNVLLSDSFLRIFVHSCGHYKDYLNDDNKFDLDGFVQHPKKKARKRFLKWFTQTSMFSTFIDTIIVDKNHFKIFDRRIQIYGSQDATVVLEKMRDWIKD